MINKRNRGWYRNKYRIDSQVFSYRIDSEVKCTHSYSKYHDNGYEICVCVSHSPPHISRTKDQREWRECCAKSDFFLGSVVPKIQQKSTHFCVSCLTVCGRLIYNIVFSLNSKRTKMRVGICTSLKSQFKDFYDLSKKRKKV